MRSPLLPVQRRESVKENFVFGSFFLLLVTQ